LAAKTAAEEQARIERELKELEEKKVEMDEELRIKKIESLQAELEKVKKERESKETILSKYSWARLRSSIKRLKMLRKRKKSKSRRPRCSRSLISKYKN